MYDYIKMIQKTQHNLFQGFALQAWKFPAENTSAMLSLAHLLGICCSDGSTTYG